MASATNGVSDDTQMFTTPNVWRWSSKYALIPCTFQIVSVVQSKQRKLWIGGMLWFNNAIYNVAKKSTRELLF